jgi:hypothetical protein
MTRYGWAVVDKYGEQAMLRDKKAGKDKIVLVATCFELAHLGDKACVHCSLKWAGPKCKKKGITGQVTSRPIRREAGKK